MSQARPNPLGPHDLGGLPGGSIDRREQDAAYWERQIDAMVMLMFHKDVMVDAAQLRRGIESLGSDVYEQLSYYERWAASAAFNAVERGLVTRQELDARIAEVRARRPEST